MQGGRRLEGFVELGVGRCHCVAHRLAASLHGGDAHPDAEHRQQQVRHIATAQAKLGRKQGDQGLKTRTEAAHGRSDRKFRTAEASALGATLAVELDVRHDRLGGRKLGELADLRIQPRGLFQRRTAVNAFLRIQIHDLVDLVFRDQILGDALVAGLATDFPARRLFRRRRSTKAIRARWLGTVARVGAEKRLKFGDARLSGLQIRG